MKRALAKAIVLMILGAAPVFGQDVTRPAMPSPIGTVVEQLPEGSRSVVVAGNAYYFHNGVFYLPDPAGYVVAGLLAPPRYEQPVDPSTPSVGINGRWLDRDELAHLYHLDLDGALLVERVVAGSPADQAGLRGGFIPAKIGEGEILLGGDLIVEMAIPSPCRGECLLQAPHQFSQLDEVPVTLLRAGRLLTTVIQF
jgi:hypothetical protein